MSRYGTDIINSQNKTTMKKKFLLCIALALLYDFANAETLKCTVQEKEVYLANKSVIDSLLYLRYPEEIVKITNRYLVPKKDRGRLEYLVKNREFKYICQDFIYKDSLEKRVHNKLIIDRVYQDSINLILIPEYRNQLSGENLSYALHCRNLLNLDSIQYSYIMDKALDMARRIRKDYRINLWNEEMEILKRTLDRQQLRSFFARKNANKVATEFNKAWTKLKDAGLTEQLDSIKDGNDAINFMSSRQMIKDLYRSYGTSQKKYLAELEKSKPKLISMLEGIDKKARIEEKNKTIGKEFVW